MSTLASNWCSKSFPSPGLPPVTVGSIHVTTQTMGPDPDPDGYQVAVHQDTRTMAANAFGRFQNLSLGPHAVSLALAKLKTAQSPTTRAMTQDSTLALGASRVIDARGRLLTPEPNDNRMLALIDRLRAADASVTPTLHIFAQRYGLTWFTSPPRDPNEDTSGWTATDRARAVAGYRVMASYVKRAYDAGVRLNVGTDTAEPGKSVLSEMLLLHDAGIPMPSVFRIATLDSARGIGHEAEYGSIEPGKRANMVLFDRDPLTQPRDLLSAKTTLKDGVVMPLFAIPALK